MSFEIFSNVMSNLVDLHVPLVRLTRKQFKLSLKPWITKGIQRSIIIRDRFLNLSRSSVNQEHKTLYFNDYKRYRNAIVNLCRLSKSNHYSKFFRLNIKSAHKIWQGVNEIISSHSSSLSSPIFFRLITL